MATITFNIPDANVDDPVVGDNVPLVQALVRAIAENHGYNPAQDGTKAAFARAELKAWLRDEWRQYKAPARAQTEYDQAAAEADAETEGVSIS